MTFLAFVLSPAKAALLNRVIDQYNITRPILIQEGPDKGKFYIDCEIVERFPVLLDVLERSKLTLNGIIEQLLDTAVINY
jgi:hypothetical protein